MSSSGSGSDVEARRGVRFIAPMPRLGDGAAWWRDRLARIEDLGFDEAAISEHYSHGWAMEPLAALCFGLALTSRLRFLTLVINNDLRHPALLAKALATADVLSDGRVSLGIGAGWLPDDYQRLGVAFEPPAVRMARLRAAVEIIKELFAGRSVTVHGEFYSVTDLEPLPLPAQPSGPPLLIGAGGRRMLDLAGRLADIVGIHAKLTPKGFDFAAADEYTASAITAKIEQVRAAAAAAGRPQPAIELTPAIVVIDGQPSATQRGSFTEYIEQHPDRFADTPAVLVGSADSVADSVRRWSDALGIRFWHLGGATESVGRVIRAYRR